MASRYSATALVLAVVSVGMIGCSSTGSSSKATVVVPQTVRAPDRVHPEIEPYVPHFVDALRVRGLNVGQTTDPNALELKFEFNPNPFNMRIAALLMQHGVPVVSASATNPGWGTVIARGSALNGRAEAALKSFQEQLDELQLRMKIVPDSSN